MVTDFSYHFLSHSPSYLIVGGRTFVRLEWQLKISSDGEKAVFYEKRKPSKPWDSIEFWCVSWREINETSLTLDGIGGSPMKTINFTNSFVRKHQSECLSNSYQLSIFHASPTSFSHVFQTLSPGAISCCTLRVSDKFKTTTINNNSKNTIRLIS